MFVSLWYKILTSLAWYQRNSVYFSYSSCVYVRSFKIQVWLKWGRNPQFGNLPNSHYSRALYVNVMRHTGSAFANYLYILRMCSGYRCWATNQSNLCITLNPQYSLEKGVLLHSNITLIILVDITISVQPDTHLNNNVFGTWRPLTLKPWGVQAVLSTGCINVSFFAWGAHNGLIIIICNSVTMYHL